MYSIKDILNEDIDGWFYENELQKIYKNEDSIFRIEKVLKRRKNGQEIFVKWMGWPTKFNTWINAESIHKD